MSQITNLALILLSTFFLLLSGQRSYGAATAAPTYIPIPMVSTRQDLPDVMTFSVWLGSQSRTTWVMACPTLSRWGHTFRRQHAIQFIRPYDYPDVLFSFWPADALVSVRFAAGVGPPPTCEDMEASHTWP